MAYRAPSANPYNIRPGEVSPFVDLSGQSQHIDNRYRGLTTLVPRLATMGVTAGLGAAAMPFLLGAGGAGGTAAAASTGARVASGSRLGSILGSNAMNLGVNAGLSLLGLRSQNRANDRASREAMAAAARQEALAREELGARTRAEDLDRTDAKAAQDAANELRRRELASSEEERAFRRMEYEREQARLEPYRQYQQRALLRLQALLGGR